MNILIVLLVLIAIPFAAALFTSKNYLIEREIIINKPRQQVFDYIKLLKNQDNYSKWVMTDPSSRKDYKGIDGTVGFVYAWDSDNKQVGKGEQEIISITGGQKIDTEVRFFKPFTAKALNSFITSSLSAEQTKVQWIFTGLRNYPMRVMHLLLNLKNALGKDMQISLATLKTALENY